MTKTISTLVPSLFTRRMPVGGIQTHRRDHDARDHPASARPHTSFPLALTVGLMTIGVIAIISLLQLLLSYLG